MVLELEETVGRFWHRLIGATESYPHHPEAAVSLDPLRHRLAVFFRGLGGEQGIRLAACGSTTSGHRLNFRQRLGLGTERLERATLDGETLLLPERLDCFPDPTLNEQLYFWLAAFFANAIPPIQRPGDPLQADILVLRAAHQTSTRVLEHWPGLRAVYPGLAASLLEIRPPRRLTGWEQAMEQAIIGLLGGTPPQDEQARQILAIALDSHQPIRHLAAPRNYRPFLPVPLWGEITERGTSPPRTGDEQEGGGAEAEDDRQRKAKRRNYDQAERNDPLLLNNFENILTLAEMANVNRSVEDDDPDAARQAAEELDEITITNHQQYAATRLKFDLDLAPDAVDTGPLSAEHTYPEWDHTRQCYHRDHCRVIAGPAGQEGEDWQPDAAARRRIRLVRRQFEALRPRRQTFPAQSDGDELDLAAVVRSVTDRRAGGSGSDRVYTQARNAARDLAVAVLIDVSLSTDSWVENRRVLDVEKEAVTALIHGLAACGDDHAVFTFTSRKRGWVGVRTVKDFDEPLSGAVERRIQSLKPGYYTRIGAALRHTTECLNRRPNRHRLIILLTDGKPNDLDHYEGRYGVEDTRKAIQEARQQGLAVFGITVDKKARDYFPYLFGRGSYAIVGHIVRLPSALPLIYRQLVG